MKENKGIFGKIEGIIGKTLVPIANKVDRRASFNSN